MLSELDKITKKKRDNSLVVAQSHMDRIVKDFAYQCDIFGKEFKTYLDSQCKQDTRVEPRQSLRDVTPGRSRLGKRPATCC